MTKLRCCECQLLKPSLVLMQTPRGLACDICREYVQALPVPERPSAHAAYYSVTAGITDGGTTGAP
jgi:hypothetical protein